MNQIERRRREKKNSGKEGRQTKCEGRKEVGQGRVMVGVCSFDAIQSAVRYRLDEADIPCSIMLCHI